MLNLNFFFCFYGNRCNSKNIKSRDTPIIAVSQNQITVTLNPIFDDTTFLIILVAIRFCTGQFQGNQPLSSLVFICNINNYKWNSFNGYVQIIKNRRLFTYFVCLSCKFEIFIKIFYKVEKRSLIMLQITNYLTLKYKHSNYN